VALLPIPCAGPWNPEDRGEHYIATLFGEVTVRFPGFQGLSAITSR
jgi:hypothetical protein